MQTLGLASKPESKQKAPRQGDKKVNHKVRKDTKVKEVQDRNTFEDRLKSKFNLQRKENGPANDDPEDPYAFPEPPSKPLQGAARPDRSPKTKCPSGQVSPTEANHKTRMPELSSASLFSSTPIAQRYPELAEKLEKARVKPEVKLKLELKPPIKTSTVQRSSRTMNRLQTKIAQNKIKDKLKKNQETLPPESPLVPSPSSLPEKGCVENGRLETGHPQHNTGISHLQQQLLTISQLPAVSSQLPGLAVSLPAQLPVSLPAQLPASSQPASSLPKQCHRAGSQPVNVSKLSVMTGQFMSRGLSMSAPRSVENYPSSTPLLSAENYPTSTPQAQAIVPGALSINPTLSLFTAPLTNALEQLNPPASRPSTAQITSTEPPIAPSSLATPSTPAPTCQGAASPRPPSVLPAKYSPTCLSTQELQRCLRTRSALCYYTTCLQHRHSNQHLLPSGELSLVS